MNIDFDPAQLRDRAQATADHWAKQAQESGDRSDQVKADKANALVKQVDHLIAEAQKDIRVHRHPTARIARIRRLTLTLIGANEKAGIKLLAQSSVSQ
jgi:hypothetical protein